MTALVPGRMHLEDGRLAFCYRNEADIQSAMAQLAEAYGWRVQTEVVVPGWGRLDMVLHGLPDVDNFELVLEFKDKLTKLSTIRKAFQQADGYHRWLAQEIEHEPNPVILAVAECDYTLTNDIAYSYRNSVTLMSVGQAMNSITSSRGAFARLSDARARAVAATSSARLHQHAYNDLRDAEDKARRSRDRLIRRSRNSTAVPALSRSGEGETAEVAS